MLCCVVLCCVIGEMKDGILHDCRCMSYEWSVVLYYRRDVRGEGILHDCRCMSCCEFVVKRYASLAPVRTSRLFLEVRVGLDCEGNTVSVLLLTYYCIGAECEWMLPVRAVTRLKMYVMHSLL